MGGAGEGALPWIASPAIDGSGLNFAVPEPGPPPRRGCNGLMQRHVILGRQPQSDDPKGRSRVAVRTAPGPADALSLAKYRLASRWQPLVRFWQCVLAFAVALAFLLEVLGPPQGFGDSDAALEAAALALDRGPVATTSPPAGKPVEAGRPATSAPMRPEPDQPVPGIQPPGDAAQGDAPRARAAMVVHPARAEGGAAVASRLAAQSGLAPDQVDVGTVAEARSEAVVRFYAAGDHPLARRLGKELGKMGYSWRIENFSARPWAWKDQAIEVFLPDK